MSASDGKCLPESAGPCQFLRQCRQIVLVVELQVQRAFVLAGGHGDTPSQAAFQADLDFLVKAVLMRKLELEEISSAIAPYLKK